MREQPDGEPRYAMLETITEFARELLAASTAGQAFHQRHAQYFLAFAEQAEPHLEGEEQARWLALLQTEHANHRAAMQWALEQAAQGDTDALVTSFRLTAALWWFWHISGHVPEGRAQMEMVMDLLRANQAVLQTSMQPAGWSRMYAKTLFMLGAYSTWTADHHDERGWSLLAESLDLYRELDQKEDMAWTLLFMGYGAQRIGRFTEADTFLTEGLALFRALGDDRGAGMVLQGLGMIALRSGDDERGGVWLAESLALFTTLGDVRSIAASRATLGAVRLRQGDLVRANALLGESLKVRLQIGDKGGIAWCLEWLAEAALLGLPPPSGPLRAARLLGAAKALRAAVGLPIDPVDQPGNERVVTAVQAKLSDRAFIAAWEAGRAMTPERAGAYALIADDDGTAQDLVSRFVMSRSR
jgi:tetratricopeptide (TPR) repeat protein